MAYITPTFIQHSKCFRFPSPFLSFQEQRHALSQNMIMSIIVRHPYFQIPTKQIEKYYIPGKAGNVVEPEKIKLGQWRPLLVLYNWTTSSLQQVLHNHPSSCKHF